MLQGRFTITQPSLVARIRYLKESWQCTSMTDFVQELVLDHEKQERIIEELLTGKREDVLK